MRLLFVARFLAVFALLLVAGWALDASVRYATALEHATSLTSPWINGWQLESRGGSGAAQQLWYRSGHQQIELQLNLEALSLGTLPLLSLLGATPGLGVAPLAARAGLGVLGLFSLDLLVLLLYPTLVGQPSAFTDILGTFLGLLTFVGGPVILWFLLTFEQLGSVWRLDDGPGSSSARASRQAGKRRPTSRRGI